MLSSGLTRFTELTGAGETTVARHRFAIVLITISSVGFSFAGLIVRSIEDATLWQLNLMRSGFMVGVLATLLLLQYRSQVFSSFRRIGPLGLLGGTLIGIAPVFYLLAMTHTSVANALFILATVPFFTSLLAWLWLGERVRPGTWLAMLVALIGIMMMVAEGIAIGALFGNAMALMCALFFSVFAVIVRARRNVDMLPTLVVGGMVTCVIAFTMSWPDWLPGARDVFLCFLWGGVISGVLGNWLFIKAIRHLAAAEVTLLMMTEFVLGPLWVLIFVGEVPARYTILGGILVLGAVGVRAWSDLRVGRAPSPHTGQSSGV